MEQDLKEYVEEIQHKAQIMFLTNRFFMIGLFPSYYFSYNSTFFDYKK